MLNLFQHLDLWTRKPIRRAQGPEFIEGQVQGDETGHKLKSVCLYPSYAGLKPEGLSKQLRGVYTRTNHSTSLMVVLSLSKDKIEFEGYTDPIQSISTII